MDHPESEAKTRADGEVVWGNGRFSSHNGKQVRAEAGGKILHRADGGGRKSGGPGCRVDLKSPLDSENVADDEGQGIKHEKLVQQFEQLLPNISRLRFKDGGEKAPGIGNSSNPIKEALKSKKAKSRRRQGGRTNHLPRRGK